MLLFVNGSALLEAAKELGDFEILYSKWNNAHNNNKNR